MLLASRPGSRATAALDRRAVPLLRRNRRRLETFRLDWLMIFLQGSCALTKMSSALGAEAPGGLWDLRGIELVRPGVICSDAGQNGRNAVTR